MREVLAVLAIRVFPPIVNIIVTTPFGFVSVAANANTIFVVVYVIVSSITKCVTITVLQPGPTATDFFNRAGMEHTKVGSEGKFTNDPAEVAKQGYEALMDGKDHIFAE